MSANESISPATPQDKLPTYVQVIRITVPAITPWEAKRFQQFINSLLVLPGPIALKITAHQNMLSWSIEIPDPQVNAVVKAIYANCPGADVKISNKNDAKAGIFLYQLHGVAPFIAPLQTAELLKERDPLIPLLTIMNDLEEQEAMQLSLTLKHARPEYRELGLKMSQESLTNWYHYLTVPSTVMAMTLKASGADQRDKYAPELQKLVNHKLNSTLMETDLFFKISANSPQRANEIMGLIGPALAIFERVSCNFLVQAQENSHALVLTAEEVAALWHLPTENCQIEGIKWANSKSSPLPIQLSQVKEGNRLGVNAYQGKTREILVPYKDRESHINIIGKTKVGKSNFMHHLIHQDIANGKGVAVIDPHGDLISDVLHCSIPGHREKDVVLFDMTDKEFPVGLNLLATSQKVTKTEVASLTLEVIRKMFEDNWNTGRMERALHAALMGLMNIPGSTLMDVDTLFSNSDFRSQVIDKETDPVALSFWLNVYTSATAKVQAQIAAPITNRIAILKRM